MLAAMLLLWQTELGQQSSWSFTNSADSALKAQPQAEILIGAE